MIHHSSASEARAALLEEAVRRELANDQVLWRGASQRTSWTSLLVGEWFPLCFAGFWLGLWVWLAVSSWWRGYSAAPFIVLFFMTALPVVFALRTLLRDQPEQRYAVTTQRVVIIELSEGLHILSLDASSIRSISTERSEGAGGQILFHRRLDHVAPDVARPAPVGFYNLASLAEPAAALAEMLRNA